MDKLKEQLAPVQKHLFWIGCGLILLVTLFSWYRATSHLQTEHTRLKADITSSFDLVTNIKGNHPNDNTIKGMDGLIEETGEKVAVRWAELARNQEKVLVWPTYAFDQVFIERVNSLRPPELTVTDGQNEIDGENKRIYRDHVEKVFPELAKIIGAKWTGRVTASSGMGGMPGMGAMPGGDMGPPGGMMTGPGAGAMMPGVGRQQAGDDDSLVLWNSGNQSQLMSDHFSFIASEADLPSTRQILYAQEDLWVLESLLNTIKATNETNGPITHRHEAAIKTIEAIQIGRGAVQESGRVTPVGKAASEGGMDGGTSGMMAGMADGASMMSQMMSAGGPGEMAEPGGGGAPGESPGAGPAAAAGPGAAAGSMATAGRSDSLADNRYVDRDYQGVLSSRLVSAMKGQPEKPEDLFLAVAKRVPVRLVFKMDQRRVATLLAECGNSKLPVEVKQVRVNRQSATFGGGGGGMMGGMMEPGGAEAPGGADPAGMMAGMMGGMMGGVGGFGGNANNPNRQTIADSNLDPNEIGVEIYGIVYIYNPVNRAVLGLKEEAPATPPTVTTTPTPTSTTPPAAPPVNTGAAAGPNVTSPVVN
jgi:hypothetical protein